ncbi:MAG: ribonucleoside triphosphate reductase [Verrucomicrobiota bacterium]
MESLNPLDYIIKRDGRKDRFEPKKLLAAFLKAGEASGEFGQDEAVTLARRVVSQLQVYLGTDTPTVQDVQDTMEEVLIASPYKKTAKAVLLYHDQHAKMRSLATAADIELMDGYLNCLDWEVRENSNMTYSLQGLNHYLSADITKAYWLNKLYPPAVRDAHTDGSMHMHDLNLLSVYCVGWDLHDLLMQGFGGVPGKIEAGPARHFRSALGQVINFFYTLQGEAAGAQAFSSFDTLLAPFIRHDKLDYNGVKQALQEFIFNINVPTRVGFQTPFTNVTLDLECPKHYADQPVVIGGELQDYTYRECQKEMDLFNKAFFEVMAQGDAKGRIMTFPIPTINLTKDFQWDKPEYEGLWEMTAKYGVPYFSNFINSDMDPEDARSMCCRLRIDNTQLEMRGGGLFGAHPLTGSIGVVTINLPRIGYQSWTEQDFFERLDHLMDLAKDSLEIKRKVLENLTDKNLYPYTKHYLRHMKERFDCYWKNHFSTIGICGMNEALVNFNQSHIGTAEGQRFAKKILDHMRERLVSYQQETGNNYNLEATPAEGTSFRLALADKKRFPRILVANEEDTHSGSVPYYTNSSHLPVNYTDDPFEALDLQDGLQSRYTGGTVLHLFLGERIQDHRTVKSFIKKVAHNYTLPYFSLTPTFSISPEVGYLPGEHHTCPVSGKPCEVYSRVVGYLRPVQQWNDGKQAEYKNRKVYRVEEVAPEAEAAGVAAGETESSQA